MGLSTHKRTTNASDDELLRQLSSDLERLLPANVQNDYDLLILAMRRLPRGLHAMAAIHRLDLSMALDDLGWHFYNFYHWDFANETQWGLRELEAGEVAEIFESARVLIEPHWNEIGSLRAVGSKAFVDWYSESGLQNVLDALNHRLWAICGQSPYGLMQFWLDYARKYPGRLMEAR